MKLKIFVNSTILAISAVLTASFAQAGDNAPGYTEDSWGNIIRSGSGKCVHTGNWKPEMATVVGCDGVTADTSVKVKRGGGKLGQLTTVVMPSTALFSFDSAELTDEGKRTIEAYRETLIPELAEAYAGIIIGHTDSMGDAKYNMKLSERRAESVSDYLIATGTPAEKLRVVGRGEEEPIASNDTKAGQAENRRVEVIVVAEPRALDAMRIPSLTLFARRSAELTDEGKKVIEEYRQKAQEQFRRASYIEIIGHTDDVGDDDYNQELSEQRAMSVYNYLQQTGLNVSNVNVLGMGEIMPIASNKTEEGRAENRRVEILILGRDR